MGMRGLREGRTGAWLGALLLVAACDQGSGHLEGAWLVVPDCGGSGRAQRFEPFARELGVMGASEEDGALTLRFAPVGAGWASSDQLVVVLEAAETARAEIAREGEVRWPIAEADGRLPISPEVAASVALLSTCPRLTAGLAASSGAATFTSLGRRDGERVRGTLSFDVVDRRTGELLGEDFRADFDFEIAVGQPYRSFSPREL